MKLKRSVFPTSDDIYIELDGRKIGVVESYKAKTTKESRYIEAFGQSEPVGTTSGRTRHVIELGRVYMCDDAVSDDIDFFSASQFNLVIVKPDRRIIYTGCEWLNIIESAQIGDVIHENIQIAATKRLELR